MGRTPEGAVPAEGPGVPAGAVLPSPHAHGGASVSRTMGLVMAALAPATLFGFWMFGWPAVHLFMMTLAACVLAEYGCQRLMGRRSSLGDGSAVLTGWLLALSLPPWAPGWIGVLGGAIAIVVGKQVFGGLGQNPFNPAMVARVVLLVSFPVAMTQWVVPVPMGSPGAPDFVHGLQITLAAPPLPDAIASASLLGHAKTELSRGADLAQVLGAAATPPHDWTGLRPGSLGETGALLLLAGGLFLVFAGVIGWHLPAAVLLGLAVPALVGHALAPARFLPADLHLVSGATVLGAFFIATDYVTSPNTTAGQWLFGLGIGVLTWIIRSFGGYPEGMAFAVLLMNALVPAIDRWLRPRILGRDRAGRPLALPGD
ncbi:MAG: RnfABCDGE type electron transport complex subunit D [Rhodocyclaceae bacterium]|nr:RnfABCDGE type electron transport complex subunit D [Rhodocyclaceae bacterium]